MTKPISLRQLAAEIRAEAQCELNADGQAIQPSDPGRCVGETKHQAATTLAPSAPDPQATPETDAKRKRYTILIDGETVHDLLADCLDHAADLERRLAAALRECEELRGQCVDAELEMSALRVERDSLRAKLEQFSDIDMVLMEIGHQVEARDGEQIVAAVFRYVANVKDLRAQLAAATERLGAVLIGLECEKVHQLILERPETLRTVGAEIAKAAKMGADEYKAATRPVGDEEVADSIEVCRQHNFMITASLLERLWRENERQRDEMTQAVARIAQLETMRLSIEKMPMDKAKELVERAQAAERALAERNEDVERLKRIELVLIDAPKEHVLSLVHDRHSLVVKVWLNRLLDAARKAGA